MRFDDEIKYCILLEMARNLKEKGGLSEEEYQEVKAMLFEKYNPPVTALLLEYRGKQR